MSDYTEQPLKEHKDEQVDTEFEIQDLDISDIREQANAMSCD